MDFFANRLDGAVKIHKHMRQYKNKQETTIQQLLLLKLLLMRRKEAARLTAIMMHTAHTHHLWPIKRNSSEFAV